MTTRITRILKEVGYGKKVYPFGADFNVFTDINPNFDIPNDHAIAVYGFHLRGILDNANYYWSFQLRFDGIYGDGSLYFVSFGADTADSPIQKDFEASSIHNPIPGERLFNTYVLANQGGNITMHFGAANLVISTTFSPGNNHYSPGTLSHFTLEYDEIVPDGAGGVHPYNYFDKAGNYHATNDGILYKRANNGRPDSPGVGFDTISTAGIANTDETLIEGRCIRDYRETVLVTYAKIKTSDGSGLGTFYTTSNDDGKTWETPILAIPGGKHPTCAEQHDGTFSTVIVAAFVEGAVTNQGTLQAISRNAGDAAWSTLFTFLNDQGKPISVNSDSFGLCYSDKAPGLWLLHCSEVGQSSTTHFYSADECKTWTKVG